VRVEGKLPLLLEGPKSELKDDMDGGREESATEAADAAVAAEAAAAAGAAGMGPLSSSCLRFLLPLCAPIDPPVESEFEVGC
jgi:hypothetical protein